MDECCRESCSVPNSHPRHCLGTFITMRLSRALSRTEQGPRARRLRGTHDALDSPEPGRTGKYPARIFANRTGQSSLRCDTYKWWTRDSRDSFPRAWGPRSSGTSGEVGGRVVGCCVFLVSKVSAARERKVRERGTTLRGGEGEPLEDK